LRSYVTYLFNQELGNAIDYLFLPLSIPLVHGGIT
jgi:hypothetical protein